MNLSKFGQFFSDGEMFSMTRLILFIWSLLIISVWTFNSIISGVLQDIPNGIVILLGSLIASKAAQNFTERV